MIKRYLLSAVILFSGLNAAIQIQDDSFTCRFSAGIEQACSDSLGEEVENTSKISIAILAQQDGANFDGLVINTIKELVNQLDEKNAANVYLLSQKEIIDGIWDYLNSENTENIIEKDIKCKEEESSEEKKFNQTSRKLQEKLFEIVSEKGTVLIEAICLPKFSEKVRMGIQNIMTEFIQNNEWTKKPTLQELRENFSSSTKNLLTSMVSIFEENGYEIDKKALGL